MYVGFVHLPFDDIFLLLNGSKDLSILKEKIKKKQVFWNKVRSVEKETKENPWFLIVKHSEIIVLFHLHIPLLCGWWDHWRILKK